MLDLIEDGKIGVIITKDLSRLGRNYIEVGSYTEIYFPKNNVRYIAVNDNFDSMYTDGNELAPVQKFVQRMVCEGYKQKDPRRKTGKRRKKENASVQDRLTAMLRTRTIKNHIIVDKETAPAVQKIFSMALRGSVRR